MKMPLTVATLEKLIWMLIFGGLFVLGLGLAVERSDFALGWSMVVAGGIATAVGVVLIVVRSRIAR